MAKEKQALNYLVSLAVAEHNLSPKEIKTLNKHVDFLDCEHFKDHFNMEDRCKAIPDDSYSRFRMIYTLEQKLIENGQLSDKKIDIMTQLFSYFPIKRDRLRELILYLKLNISSNRGAREAFDKLSYLMKPSRAQLEI